jgi:hypothetical protein
MGGFTTGFGAGGGMATRQTGEPSQFDLQKKMKQTQPGGAFPLGGAGGVMTPPPVKPYGVGGGAPPPLGGAGGVMTPPTAPPGGGFGGRMPQPPTAGQQLGGLMQPSPWARVGGGVGYGPGGAAPGRGGRVPLGGAGGGMPQKPYGGGRGGPIGGMQTNAPSRTGLMGFGGQHPELDPYQY